MTERLNTSIETLYTVFERYQGKSKLEGSPLHADLDLWRNKLRSKKLRDLTDEDLSLFAGKVISTWGDESDFRCYLPRMLELTALLKTPYEIWIRYSKLEDARWKDWESAEQISINEFTIALWDNLLRDDSDRADLEFKDYFHAIAYFYPNFSEVLMVWETNDSFASIKHLVEYVFSENQNLFEKNFIPGREKNKKNIEEFKRWLTSDKIIQKVEGAFFDHGQEEIGEKISWVEQILRG